MNLKSKRALITGAARRIGAAIARSLAGEGCHLLLHYRKSKREVESLARELRKNGNQVEIYRADLEKEKEVSKLCREVLLNGGVDILINNASLYYPTPIKNLKWKDWERMIAVNLTAPAFLALRLGNDMKKKGGRIINLADTASFRPYRDYLPYCTSKGGIVTLTRALALELAPKVLVNSISPGPIEPAPWEPSRVIRSIQERMPLGKWGGPQEIAKGVVFFCRSDFATGSNLVIDGGYQYV